MQYQLQSQWYLAEYHLIWILLLITLSAGFEFGIGLPLLSLYIFFYLLHRLPIRARPLVSLFVTLLIGSLYAVSWPLFFLCVTVSELFFQAFLVNTRSHKYLLIQTLFCCTALWVLAAILFSGSLLTGIFTQLGVIALLVLYKKMKQRWSFL